MILSFFLSITIFLLSILVLLQSTFLNRKFFEDTLTESSYCQNLLEKLNISLVSLGIPGNFNDDFMRSLVTEEKIKTDILKYVDEIFTGNVPKNIAEGLEEEIYNKFKDNAESRKIVVTTETESSLRLLSEECVNSYMNLVKFPFTSQINSVFSKVKSPFMIALGAVVSLTTIILAFLYALHKKNKLDFLKYIIYSFTTSSLYLLFVYTILANSKKVERVAIQNKAFYYFVVNFFQKIFSCVLYSGIINICLDILFIFLYTYTTHKLLLKKNI